MVKHYWYCLKNLRIRQSLRWAWKLTFLQRWKPHRKLEAISRTKKLSRILSTLKLLNSIREAVWCLIRSATYLKGQLSYKRKAMMKSLYLLWSNRVRLMATESSSRSRNFRTGHKRHSQNLCQSLTWSRADYTQQLLNHQKISLCARPLVLARLTSQCSLFFKFWAKKDVRTVLLI